MSAKPYATCRVAELAEKADPLTWLAGDLLLEGGAAILGGQPKSFKSFLSLELCVAVATATPCAERFPVARAGPVLLLSAEDPDAVVVERLSALARSRRVDLEMLDINIFVEPSIRLPEGLDRLTATVERTNPRLLVLDPLIRIHRADENSAAEMSVILDGLRNLARQTRTSVLLVHHSRKAGGASGGAALRGSSDLWAFGDTNLYLRKLGVGEALELRVEHRAASPPPPLRLELVTAGDTARFCPVTGDSGLTDLSASILATLAGASAPVPSSTLRSQLGVRNQVLSDALHQLVELGRLRRHGRDGWVLDNASP
jgi:hypothetical protein